MKKFSRVTAIIIFCAVSAAVLTTVSPLSGEYRFREFREDRSRFERYTENAEKELSAEEWQSILDSGREEMRASWERIADEEMRRYIREGGDEGEIRDPLKRPARSGSVILTQSRHGKGCLVFPEGGPDLSCSKPAGT
jgi:hypothetical protein